MKYVNSDYDSRNYAKQSNDAATADDDDLALKKKTKEKEQANKQIMRGSR